MNNKVKFLRGTSDEYAIAEKDSDTIYFTTDDGKLYIGDKEVSGSDITIDDVLSDTSTNPVQGNVIKQAIDSKADKTVATTSADGLMSAEDKVKLDAFEITTDGGKLHDKDIATTDIIPDLSAYAKKSDIPTELPANGGNADTVGDFDAYHMGTTTYDGTHYPPEQFPVYCQYNTYDDGRFAFLIDSSYQPENSYEVRCDYASNSGNADTLGKKSISDFIYAHGYYTGNVDDIKYPFSGIVINATGIPPQTSVWGTMLCYGGGTGSFAQIWVSNDDNATMFVRHSDGNRWTEWSEIYASGNKPYITGSATVAANTNICESNHGFIPSAVIWWNSESSGVAKPLSETQFIMDSVLTYSRAINYMMFK